MGTVRSRTMVVAMGLLIAACGGGDDGGSAFDIADDPSGNKPAGDGANDEANGGVPGVNGFELVDAPTVTADPGFAVVEVDGQRLEYPVAGAINVVCDIEADSVQVNIQTPEGHSMALNVSNLTGSWTGSLTAATGGNAVYGSSFDDGVVGIGSNAVSYEGPIDKVVDFDITNAEEMSGTVAVNCDSPGGDPVAQVGDDAFTFPISGAQSFQCEVAPDSFEIRVNRLALEGLQLELQGAHSGDQWVGAVVVYTPDGNWTGSLPPDGAGLVVDGATVAFDGVFTGPDGAEVDGSASATCS